MNPKPLPFLPSPLPNATTVGQIIRNLRQQRHLTQAELGRRIGMRPGPMNNIEQGRNLPSTPVLCRIAAVLDISLDALLARPTPYVRAPPTAPLVCAETSETHRDTYLRSETPAQYGVSPPRPTLDSIALSLPAATPVRLLVAAQPPSPTLLTTLDELAQAYLTLEDLCGATRRAAIPLRLAMPHSEPGIENLAMQVRALLGVGPAVIFDYLELLENAGLRVIFAPLPDNLPSAACYDAASENAFLFISTAGRVNAERQLFLLIAELGRIYCHTGGVGQVKGRTKTLDAEHVAKKFTAFFLMPAEAVHATVRQVGVKEDAWTWELLLRLKHRFGVSAETFLYRLGEIDLIAPATQATLKTRLLAHYAASGIDCEPDGSRRLLSPNGRLGDLLLAAAAAVEPARARELATARRLLSRHGVKAGMPAANRKDR